MRKFVLMILAIGLVSTTSVIAGEKKQCKYSAAECKKMIIQSMEKQGMIGVDGEVNKEKRDSLSNLSLKVQMQKKPVSRKAIS